MENNYNLIVIAFENRGTPMSDYMLLQIHDTASKYKVEQQMCLYFDETLDESGIKQKLNEFKQGSKNKKKKTKYIVFQSLEYDMSNPQEYSELFSNVNSFAKEQNITIVILLKHPILFDYTLALNDFKTEHIDLLILVEQLWPDHNVARVIKNSCGNVGNFIMEVKEETKNDRKIKKIYCKQNHKKS